MNLDELHDAAERASRELAGWPWWRRTLAAIPLTAQRRMRDRLRRRMLDWYVAID